jgi:hypothetical protein
MFRKEKEIGSQEDIMNCYDMELSIGLLRGNQISPVGMDTSNQLESSPTPQTRSAIQAKTVDKNGLTKEREKELEQWMEQVKDFIRKIDTDKL